MTAWQDPDRVDVIAPNLKRRHSGVSSTIFALVPVQARDIAIASVGPRLPRDLPQIRLSSLLTLPRNRPRVWHARRNVEMLAGLALRHVLRRRLKLLFTSAAQRRHSAYTRWLIRRMDAVVATSARAAAYLERPAPVIRHGIDTDLFRPSTDRRALRQTLGLPPDAVIVGCFGRIRAQKGTDLFVETMIAVLPDHPDVVAIVMGGVTPDQREFVEGLRSRIAATGLGDRLRILPEDRGWSIAPWFQALDLYVASARWEGFGLTPIEAMACGVPVIATRVGAFEEQVIDGETGLLIPADDLPVMIAATRAALSNPDRLAAWGEAARSHVLARFRIEAEAQALNAIYRALLAAP